MEEPDGLYQLILDTIRLEAEKRKFYYLQTDELIKKLQEDEAFREAFKENVVLDMMQKLCPGEEKKFNSLLNLTWGNLIKEGKKGAAYRYLKNDGFTPPRQLKTPLKQENTVKAGDYKGARSKGNNKDRR